MYLRVYNICISTSCGIYTPVILYNKQPMHMMPGWDTDNEAQL